MFCSGIHSHPREQQLEPAVEAAAPTLVHAGARADVIRSTASSAPLHARHWQLPKPSSALSACSRGCGGARASGCVPQPVSATSTCPGCHRRCRRMPPPRSLHHMRQEAAHCCSRRHRRRSCCHHQSRPRTRPCRRQNRRRPCHPRSHRRRRLPSGCGLPQSAMTWPAAPAQARWPDPPRA